MLTTLKYSSSPTELKGPNGNKPKGHTSIHMAYLISGIDGTDVEPKHKK